MPAPVLHKYVDDGRACFANLTLGSGERIFLSVAATGFAVFRLHLGGRIPGRRLFEADAAGLKRMHRVLARETLRLPLLPRARDLHRDQGAMAGLVDAALVDIEALQAGRAVPGAVERFDTGNPPERPLALLTRLALTAHDIPDCLRLLTRARNTPG